MSTKITKKDNFKAIIEVLEQVGRKDLITVMENEIALIEKKALNAKKTKTQEKNQDIKALIISELARIGKPVSITELLGASPAVADATGSSNQKTSALMTQLKNAGQVVRSQDGKKAVFSVAE